jgi:hypothetical protein
MCVICIVVVELGLGLCSDSDIIVQVGHCVKANSGIFWTCASTAVCVCVCVCVCATLCGVCAGIGAFACIYFRHIGVRNNLGTMFLPAHG